MSSRQLWNYSSLFELNDHEETAFCCSHQYMSGKTMQWMGVWQVKSSHDDQVELKIEGRGSGYLVVVGKCISGRYLFIPSLEKGCCLSEDLQDYYWNLSHLIFQINETDAVTIISALRSYGKHLKDSAADEYAEADECEEDLNSTAADEYEEDLSSIAADIP